jgi:hypothetical protein
MHYAILPSQTAGRFTFGLIRNGAAVAGTIANDVHSTKQHSSTMHNEVHGSSPAVVTINIACAVQYQLTVKRFHVSLRIFLVMRGQLIPCFNKFG